jgi:MSHA biogenesis protein MshI
MDSSIFHSFKKKLNNDLCSFEIREDGITFAHASYKDLAQQKVKIKQLGFYPYTDLSLIEYNITEIVEKHQLREMDCNIVLHPMHYRLLLVNKPEVPAAEYRSAVKWMIKDMVSYPLEDLSLDIFAPIGLDESVSKKLYVVATQTSYLQRLVDITTKLSLTPLAIDIREFAIRNFLTKTVPENVPIIFIHPSKTSSLLLVINEQMLYFARRIPIGVDGLTQANSEFSYEVRKSLEYYSTELKQNPPSKLIVAPTLEKDKELLILLLKKVTDDISFLDINSAIDYYPPIELDQQIHVYLVIGGLLRK